MMNEFLLHKLLTIVALIVTVVFEVFLLGLFLRLPKVRKAQKDQKQSILLYINLFVDLLLDIIKLIISKVQKDWNDWKQSVLPIIIMTVVPFVSLLGRFLIFDESSHKPVLYILFLLICAAIISLILLVLGIILSSILDKFFDAIDNLKSEMFKIAILDSFCCLLLIILSEKMSFEANNTLYCNCILIPAIALDVLFFITLFQLLLSSEMHGTFIKNTLSMRVLFLISMFFLLWGILTAIVVAAVPFEAFENISYYPNVEESFGSSFFDAAYFVLVTITTVGYGDMAPKADSWPGKLIVIVIILNGLFFISAFVNAMLGSSAASDAEEPSLSVEPPKESSPEEAPDSPSAQPPSSEKNVPPHL